jgi:hypothetical protein
MTVKRLRPKPEVKSERVTWHKDSGTTVPPMVITRFIQRLSETEFEAIISAERERRRGLQT